MGLLETRLPGFQETTLNHLLLCCYLTISATSIYIGQSWAAGFASYLIPTLHIEPSQISDLAGLSVTLSFALTAILFSSYTVDLLPRPRLFLTALLLCVVVNAAVGGVSVGLDWVPLPPEVPGAVPVAAPPSPPENKGVFGTWLGTRPINGIASGIMFPSGLKWLSTRVPHEFLATASAFMACCFVLANSIAEALANICNGNAGGAALVVMVINVICAAISLTLKDSAMADNRPADFSSNAQAQMVLLAKIVRAVPVIFWVGLLNVFIDGVCLGVIAPYVQLYLTTERGFDAKYATGMTAALNFGIGIPAFWIIAAAADIFGKYFPKVNKLWFACICQLGFGATLLALAYVSNDPEYRGLFWTLVALRYFFDSSYQAPFYAGYLEMQPVQVRGSFPSMFVGTAFIGVAVAINVSGNLINQWEEEGITDPFSRLIKFAGFCQLAATVLMAILAIAKPGAEKVFATFAEATPLLKEAKPVDESAAGGCAGCFGC